MALFACGCAEEGQPPVSFCPVTPPVSLDECFSGRFFAECGGTGAPTFACSSDDCRWFVAGCAPEGYVRSACPSDDVCCQDNGTPFTASQLQRVPQQSLWWMFYGNGTAPWNRYDHVVIPVQVEPNLPDAVTELACDGFPLWSTRCDILELSAHNADMFEVRIDTPDLGGAPVLIEIERSNPPMARACNRPVTDAVSGACYAPHPVDCAVSGSIAITGLDDDQIVEGTLDLTFESGGTITGTFAIR